MNTIRSISHKYQNKKLEIYFTKKELTKILQYYSFGVAKAKWRDYSIGFSSNQANFHIYRNFSEKPIISICKKKTKIKQSSNFYMFYENKMYQLDKRLDELFAYKQRLNISIVK